MARFGYTRHFQDIPEKAADLKILGDADCDIVRCEIGGSAARTANRQPVLESILELIGPGDTLVAVSPASLCAVGSRLKTILDTTVAQGGHVEFFEPRVSSRRRSGRLFLEALRVSLTLSYKPPVATEIEALLAEGHGPTKIANRLGISRQSVYRYIWKMSANKSDRTRSRMPLAERAFEREMELHE